MNKKIMIWLGVFALTAAPVSCLRAQQVPGGGDKEEVEVTENGPGQPGADMPRKGGPGIHGAKGAAAEDMDEDSGQRVTVKVHKFIGKGQGGGGFGEGPFGGGPGMGMGGPGFLDADEAMALIKKNDAVFAKKLEDLKTVSPAKYHMAMQMAGRALAGPKMEEDPAMERDAVSSLALELDTTELSRKYDKAADADKPAIKEELKTKLGELFDLKTKAQEQRLKHMASDLAKLQKKLEARKLNKTKIVEQRADQLTGEGGDAW